MPRPKMIRTLSEQHWINATEMMVNTGADEQCAGKQGSWEFKVKKLPGTAKVERITLLNNTVAHSEVK